MGYTVRRTGAMAFSVGLGVVMFTTVGCSSSAGLFPERPDGPLVIVYQPSHQTDTGVDFNEAVVCNGIAEGALHAHTSAVQTSKVWSHDVPGLRYARQGSNTKLDHTSALVGDSLTGYAWELRESNARSPYVFVSIHNNGATNRNAIWGYIHEGDRYEAGNRVLASRLVSAIADATGLENGGVLFDSSTGRNDYRCVSTGKRAFYSLDESVNKAPVRVLLEIGDNAVSRDFLQDPANQAKMGTIIARVVEETFVK